MLLSRVLKSVESNKPSESWKLTIQPIHKKITKEEEVVGKESQETEIAQGIKEEIADLENKKADLQSQLQYFEQLIQERENRIKQLEQELENEIQQLKQQAHNEGFENGFQQGMVNGREECTQNIGTAREMIETIENEKMKRIDSSNEIILDLSIEIARKIIKDSLSDNREQWVHLVDQAITEIKENGEIKVFVHPNQFQITNKIRDDYETNPQISLSVYPDGNLAEYQCLIETKNGLIDASIDTQLEVLREKLKEVIEDE